MFAYAYQEGRGSDSRRCTSYVYLRRSKPSSTSTYVGLNPLGGLNCFVRIIIRSTAVYKTRRHFGCSEPWVYGTLGSLDSSDFIGTLGSSENPTPSPPPSSGGRVFVARRMVLRLFLESNGTLVAVSAPLVMPLCDSDIPMNVPFTILNPPCPAEQAHQKKKFY